VSAAAVVVDRVNDVAEAVGRAASRQGSGTFSPICSGSVSATFKVVEAEQRSNTSTSETLGPAISITHSSSHNSNAADHLTFGEITSPNETTSAGYRGRSLSIIWSW
jgi:hypothetical protein